MKGKNTYPYMFIDSDKVVYLYGSADDCRTIRI